MKFSGLVLSNVAAPVAATDAANKAYVDGISTALTGSYVRVSAQKLTATASNVTLSVPSTAKSVRVTMSCKTTASPGNGRRWAEIRGMVNNDGTGPYVYQYTWLDNQTSTSSTTATQVVADQAAATYMVCGIAGTSILPGFAQSQFTITGWDQPKTGYLTGEWKGGFANDTSWNTQAWGTTNYNPTATTAYTSIVLTPQTGLFAIGSEFVVEAVYDAPATGTAPIDAGNLRIINVAAPTATTDSTNKSYVDSADATTLTSAKSYADTQDATNLTAAKAYTDAKLWKSTQLLASNVATVTFSSIPSTLTTLICYYQARGDYAATSLDMAWQVNSVTTGGYYSNVRTGVFSTTTFSATPSATVNAGLVGVMPGASVSSTYWGGGQCVWQNWNSNHTANYGLNSVTQGGFAASASVYSQLNANSFALINGPYTSVTFSVWNNQGNFVAGSQFCLVGWY